MSDETKTPEAEAPKKPKSVKVTTNPTKLKNVAQTFYDGDQKAGHRDIGGVDKKGERKVCTVSYTALVQELLHSGDIIEV